jgi:hypothetical protein
LEAFDKINERTRRRRLFTNLPCIGNAVQKQLTIYLLLGMLLSISLRLRETLHGVKGVQILKGRELTNKQKKGRRLHLCWAESVEFLQSLLF